MDIEYDQNGAPILLRVAERLHILERMRDHRLDGLADVSTPTHRGKISESTAKHYRNELLAIDASMAALRYHRATIEQLPNFISALREVVEEQSDPVALQAAVKHAALVLEEYDRTVLKRAG